MHFLQIRKFRVNVEEDLYGIETSVMQGSILILFSIYINDIVEINGYPNQEISSLQFADDLFAFNFQW